MHKRLIAIVVALSGSFLALPALAQITANLPVTCNAAGSNCTIAQPVSNSDGSRVGAPGTDASSAIVPGSTVAITGSAVAKASAGNVYRVSITTGGSAGYLMGFNAVSAPADGAVTPAMCRVVAANSTLSVSYADVPARWNTGVTFVFSTTGCFTKTVSATAYFEWSVL